MARVIDYDYPEDAYLAGLLHDFGQLVLDAKFHQQYQDVLRHNWQTPHVGQGVPEWHEAVLKPAG